MRGEPDSSCWKVGGVAGPDGGGSAGSWSGEKPALGMVSEGGERYWEVLGVGVGVGGFLF